MRENRPDAARAEPGLTPSAEDRRPLSLPGKGEREGSERRWFIPVVALILIFGMAARTPLDSDLWWHLRAGQATWELGWPLTVDLFSFTRYGEAWTNHSWLSQAILYGAYRTGGYLALGALAAGLAAASMGLVYAQMEGPALLRAFLLVLASAVAALVWSPRPQLFSLALFGVLAYVLYMFKWRQRDRLWTIVPLFILWSNLHGGYALGLLLIGATIAGETLNHSLGSRGPEVVPWKGIGRLALWGLAGWLAAALNPNGAAMWAIPFRTVGVGALQEFISEWASPDFHQFVQQPFLWLLFLTLGAAGLSRRRLDGSDLLAVAGFAYLAFLARRNFGPFAMVAAPVLSRHLLSILEDGRARLEPRMAGWSAAGGAFSRLFRQDVTQAQLSPRLRLGLNAAILALLGGAALLKLTIVASPGLVARYTAESFPVEAAAWIRANRPPGLLFNDYNWGGYLVWALREYPVFVDGRTDLYDDELLRAYLQAVRGETGWEATLDRYRINLVLVPAGSGLARELGRSEGWAAAYRDGVAVVFLREGQLMIIKTSFATHTPDTPR
jgi:hypothetical protein